MARIIRMSDLDGYTRSFLTDNYPADGFHYEGEHEELIEKVTAPVEQPKKRKALRTTMRSVSVRVRKPLAGGMFASRR